MHSVSASCIHPLASTVQDNRPLLMLLSEELLAAQDSNSDSDAGEPYAAHASHILHKQTMSVSGSLGASIFGGLGPMSSFNPPVSSSVDPQLKLRILKNLFIPFKVLVAGYQGKSIHHYLKNPFLTPFNDPKLKVYYPRLNLQIIRNMSKVSLPSIWLDYEREFLILRDHSLLP